MTDYVTTYTRRDSIVGCTEMKQDVQLSFHNGFGDDESIISIKSDRAYITMEVYRCDGWTGEREERVLFQHLRNECIDALNMALIRAKSHRALMEKTGDKNGNRPRTINNEQWVEEKDPDDSGASEDITGGFRYRLSLIISDLEILTRETVKIWCNISDEDVAQLNEIKKKLTAMREAYR